MGVFTRLSLLAGCVAAASAAETFVVQFDVSVPGGDESFKVCV